jgi:hypothetical protein
VPANATNIDVTPGEAMRLIDIQANYGDEYEALTKEQCAELVEEFMHDKDSKAKVCQLTAKSQIQDMANIACNMQLLVGLLMIHLIQHLILLQQDDRPHTTGWN